MEPWLQTNFSEGQAVFSPDGRWVAYRSSESGRDEIYVQGYPERRGKWLISSASGSFPQWSRDGRELFFANLDGTLMAAEVKPGQAGIELGKVEALFRMPQSLPFQSFQPSSDGKRFLLMEPAEADRELPMVVIQNWPARLGN